MTERHEELTTFKEDSLSYSSYPPLIIMQCKILSLVLNKTAVLNDQHVFPNFMRQSLGESDSTLRLQKTLPECVAELLRLANGTNEINSTIKTNRKDYDLQKHSHSLITFVTLIGIVSFISIIGNLCLAKVLHSKRFRLMQTDRIVLCLALSELCLVLIDTPAEIYRFLSYSFVQEWLCRFHTFLESLFSSCIIFYHLLGAFDRFVYIHGQTSLTSSSLSKWCRRVSTTSGSIILLILPIICSLPLAICNCLHANIIHRPLADKICIVQYTHGILISVLLSFYILPLLFSFFLYGKLIYFIRSRHNQSYLTRTQYILPMKRNGTTESQLKKRSNKEIPINHQQVLLSPQMSSSRRLVLVNVETMGTTTTTSMAAMHSASLNSNPNNSSNSSQSSRSSTGASSTSITSPIVLYKVNSQANANANRTVLLLVLLLSSYVCCWAPYNIYTWYHFYQFSQSSSLSRTITNNTVSFIDPNPTSLITTVNNLTADLRRFIYINYSLYLLSMISMCFSFIFYFSLNKQARQEFSRFTGCICPRVKHSQQKLQRQKISKQEKNGSGQLHYRTRYQAQYPYQNERIKPTRTAIFDERYNRSKRINYPQNETAKRTVMNYGCQIQCCS